MDRIGVREVRQNASEWLRRAQAGEHIEVTKRGEVVAVLGPPCPRAESSPVSGEPAD